MNVILVQIDSTEIFTMIKTQNISFDMDSRDMKPSKVSMATCK